MGNRVLISFVVEEITGYAITLNGELLEYGKIFYEEFYSRVQELLFQATALSKRNDDETNKGTLIVVLEDFTITEGDENKYIGEELFTPYGNGVIIGMLTRIATNYSFFDYYDYEYKGFRVEDIKSEMSSHKNIIDAVSLGMYHDYQLTTST